MVLTAFIDAQLFAKKITSTVKYELLQTKSNSQEGCGTLQPVIRTL